MIDKHQTFAPTIGEFKQICKGVDGKPVTPGITHSPQMSGEVAERYLAKLQELTGAKSHAHRSQP